MNKIVLKAKNQKKFSLYCPFTNEKLYNDDSSFEIYEGAGNYLFSDAKIVFSLMQETMRRLKNIGKILLLKRLKSLLKIIRKTIF